MAAELLMDGSFCPHATQKRESRRLEADNTAGAALASTGALSGAEYTETPPPCAAIIAATFKRTRESIDNK